MSKNLSRRTFNKGVAAAGVIGVSGGLKVDAAETADIVSVEGKDVRKTTAEALNAFGGIKSVVKPGKTVGLLVNTIGSGTGSITGHDVIRETVQQCRDAGASKVTVIDWRDQKRLQINKMIKLFEEIKLDYNYLDLGNPEIWKTVEVPRGEVLKKVRVTQAIYDADVFIAMPVFKHHGSANYSGALKIYMGITHREDNRTIFHGSRKLEQCIADCHTALRPADLYIMDATAVITTRGPFGPGKMAYPNKVVIGKDPVALDTYLAPIQGIDPKTATQIVGAAKHGVGTNDLSKVKIKELKLEA